MNVIDLFGGVGGFSLGAHNAGFAVPLAIDFDRNLTKSRPVNFPLGQILHADIATLDPLATLHGAGLKPSDVCGIIGGPPCQGFSSMGARKPDDPRNEMLGEFFRFVRAIKPSFFVMENVPGILLDGSRDRLETAIETVADAYTICGPVIVNAAAYGAPTRRRRVLVIGYLASSMGTLTEADLRTVEAPQEKTVFDAIHDLPSPDDAVEIDGEYCAMYARSPERGSRGAYARWARSMPTPGLGTARVRVTPKSLLITGFKPTAHTTEVTRRFAMLEQGCTDEVSRYPRLAWDAPCPTLRAGTGADRGSYQAVRPVHPHQPRVISVREAARLQGFPDWFQFHPTQWHSFRMIGNSVSPPLAEAVLKVLRKRLRI